MWLITSLSCADADLAAEVCTSECWTCPHLLSGTCCSEQCIMPLARIVFKPYLPPYQSQRLCMC